MCHPSHPCLSFSGQPCVPQLTAPQNGSIWCTGDQVTDQNCSFACDAGFTFTGSELRECLSNNSWTGLDVICVPKHCEPLIDPPNGHVVENVEIDCGTILTTACEIRCVEGYYINDTTPYYQTCVANQTSGGVYWTEPPVCECENYSLPLYISPSLSPSSLLSSLPPSIFPSFFPSSLLSSLSPFFHLSLSLSLLSFLPCSLCFYPLYSTDIPPCHPNPCKHSGSCTEVSISSYRCDCSGTLYKGDNCETAIVHLPSIPFLTVNMTSSVFQIIARPENYIIITFMTSDLVEVSPPNVTIYKEFPVANIEITGLKSGRFPITYTITGPSASDFDEPQTFYILVLEPTDTHTPNKYFTQLGLQVGLLAPGCCMSSGLSYQCSSSPLTASFTSTCTWSPQGPGDYLSNGIIFVNVGPLQLPLSIAGADISVSPQLVQNTLPDGHLDCTDCQNSGQSCYHYDFTTRDILDLLSSRALGNTYLNRVRVLLPAWLRFAISGTPLTPNVTFSLLDYSTTLALGGSVNHIQGCEQLEVNSDGLYSVFRYHGNLTAWVDSVQSEHVLSTMEDPICFAVDICGGTATPVHITIPASSQEAILSLTQLQGYTSKGWQFTFSEALVSHTRVTPFFATFTTQYWNGTTWFTPTNPNFDLRLEATVRNWLTSKWLWINFRFNGDLFHQANPVNGQVSQWSGSKM